MVFNETTSPYSGIIQNIERESGLGLGTISGNSSPNYWLTYFLGKINEWNNIANIWIQESNDEVVHSDTNNTADNPIVYTPADDTQIFALASSVSMIRKIEMRDAVSEEYYDLDYYYEKDRIEDLYAQTKGKPTKYFLFNRNLVFDIPVDITKADRYRITYDSETHDFVIGDTTAEPGFNKRFHWLLVYGPVMDWAVTKYPDIFNKCRLKIFGTNEFDSNSLKNMLKDHYLKQNKDFEYKIKRKSINYD